MRDGLKIIQLPGRYGYSVTLIGWLRRVSGDEWQIMPGARSVYRKGSALGLAALAANGPGKDYGMLDASELPEEVHRLVIRRALVADEKAWQKHCPRPKDWRSES